jgi:hypothetical protein
VCCGTALPLKGNYVIFVYPHCPQILVLLGGYRACHWTQGSRVKPGRGGWIFLRAIKIHSTTSFGGEVKPAVQRRKILRHVKYPYSIREVLVGKIR